VTSTATESPPTGLRDAAAMVERALRQAIDEAELPENLRDAVAYATLGGGKRLRPALALLSCRAVGGNDEDALPPAMAVELIHCFSLVHDDLPAMDDDDLRRGRPTLHVHAGEAMAILAGDVMISMAFSLLAGDTGRAARLTAELAQATTAMIAGQVYDTLGGFPPGSTEEQRLQLTHRHKTGALMLAACRMGAIAGSAAPGPLAALTRYGESIGLMFQIVDDLLDVTQSTEHLGKVSGKDQQAGKLTFPGLMGVEGSRAEIRRLHETARRALNGLGPAADPLAEICDYLAVRTR
jgi:geranylgeranyl diphosphate synthase type II